MTVYEQNDLPMFEDYRHELGTLHFSDEAKDRMAQRLTSSFIERQDIIAQEVAAQARTSRKNDRSHDAPKPVLRFKTRRHLGTVAACLALLLSVAGVAYASGSLVSVSSFVSHLFGASEPTVEIVDKIGRPVGVSACAGGVTVSADAIIGDKTNVAVVFSISKDDGTAFEGIEPLDNGLYPLGFSENVEVALPLWQSHGAVGGSYFYDADPTDNTLQLVETRSYSDIEQTSLVGRTMHVHLGDLTYYGTGATGDERRVIAPGTWDLAFPLNYEDTTHELPASFDFDLNGVKATMDSLAISPVALHLTYSAPMAQAIVDAPSGEEPIEVGTLADSLLRVPVTLNLRDDSTVEVEDLGGGGFDLDEDAGIAHCEKGIFFDRIVDLDEVMGVTIGNTTIEL